MLASAPPRIPFSGELIEMIVETSQLAIRDFWTKEGNIVGTGHDIPLACPVFCTSERVSVAQR